MRLSQCAAFFQWKVEIASGNRNRPHCRRPRPGLGILLSIFVLYIVVSLIYLNLAFRCKLNAVLKDSPDDWRVRLVSQTNASALGGAGLFGPVPGAAGRVARVTRAPKGACCLCEEAFLRGSA